VTAPLFEKNHGARGATAPAGYTELLLCRHESFFYLSMHVQSGRRHDTTTVRILFPEVTKLK
jgi:hypothetical protein